MEIVWTSQGSLGGRLLSGPAAVSKDPGALDVFVILEDRQLYSYWYNEQTFKWGGPGPLGGSWSRSAAVTSKTAGQLDLFISGDDQRIHTRWFNYAQGWGPWETLDGFVSSAPGASSPAANKVSAFVADENQELEFVTLTLGQGTGPWYQFADGFKFADPPACLSDLILVRNPLDNHVYQKLPQAGELPWAPSWSSIGGY
jgi:hypothetical protein